MNNVSPNLSFDYGNPSQAVTRARSGLLREIMTAIAATFLLAVLLCGIYPLIVWGIAQAVFPHQANGSLIVDNNGAVCGSFWLGQNFTGEGYFHPRPSAAGGGYAADASGGTNLGPTSDKLINGVHGSTNDDGTPNSSADFDGIKDLATAYRKENGIDLSTPIPADAVTRSASGLDPHISPANARFQAARVAQERGIDLEIVHRLIDQNTDGRGLGFLGEPGVNVVKLNLALDAAMAKK